MDRTCFARLFFTALFGLTACTQVHAADWPHWQSTSLFQPSEAELADVPTRSNRWVIRGQSADPFFAPPAGGPVVPVQAGPGQIAPGQIGPGQIGPGPTAQTVYPAPGTDPFLSGQFGAPPASFDPFAPQQVYGINGPQPYRFGWKEMIEWGITPQQGTGSPNVGNFGWNELNYVKEWNGRGAGGGVWTFAPQFNARWFEGPTAGGGTADIPGSTHRLGLGIKYATQGVNGLAWELGFNPAVATDFDTSLSSEAWQFDAHLATFWRANPVWMWVLGVTYWDRGDDIVLPYAGAVWTPNDYFEARLLFPKARLEWFLGTPGGVASWLYVTGEYHVEAYEIGENLAASTVMQIEDWRIMGGMRWETGWLETYAEAGILFDRSVEFGAAAMTNFEPDDAFMARIGFKF